MAPQAVLDVCGAVPAERIKGIFTTCMSMRRMPSERILRLPARPAPTPAVASPQTGRGRPGATLLSRAEQSAQRRAHGGRRPAVPVPCPCLCPCPCPCPGPSWVGRRGVCTHAPLLRTAGNNFDALSALGDDLLAEGYPVSQIAQQMLEMLLGAELTIGNMQKSRIAVHIADQERQADREYQGVVAGLDASTC